MTPRYALAKLYKEIAVGDKVTTNTPREVFGSNYAGRGLVGMVVDWGDIMNLQLHELSLAEVLESTPLAEVLESTPVEEIIKYIANWCELEAEILEQGRLENADDEFLEEDKYKETYLREWAKKLT